LKFEFQMILLPLLFYLIINIGFYIGGLGLIVSSKYAPKLLMILDLISMFFSIINIFIEDHKLSFLFQAIIWCFTLIGFRFIFSLPEKKSQFI